MSEEKQIEATAKSCPYNVNGECVLDETRCTTNCEVAIWGHSLIEGYRKQSEGKWVDKPTGAYGRWQSWCSACGKHSGIGGIESNRHKPFCPNCGAKMKGENK